MKIAVSGDLHYGNTSSQQLEKMVKEAALQNPDALIIAGDVAEAIIAPTLLSECLKLFREFLECPILVVLGNHDLYTYADLPYTSWDLWFKLLKEQAQEIEDVVWLEDTNWISSGVAVVGSYLHYDYSVLGKTGPTAELDASYFIRNKPNVLADGQYFHGMPSDIDFANQIGEAFKLRLQAAQDNPDVKHIVIATHVPCIESLVTRKEQDYSWSICTPYFGNVTYEKDILGCSKVRQVVSAHSHQRIEATVERDGLLPVVANCLGSDYRNPKFIAVEIENDNN